MAGKLREIVVSDGRSPHRAQTGATLPNAGHGRRGYHIRWIDLSGTPSQ